MYSYEADLGLESKNSFPNAMIYYVATQIPTNNMTNAEKGLRTLEPVFPSTNNFKIY